MRFHRRRHQSEFKTTFSTASLKKIGKSMFNVKLKILLISVLLLIQGCAQRKPHSNDVELQVLGGEALSYQCEGNAQIKVKYYSLSDSSLSFVKLQLPNDPEITLPSVLSASGINYSNSSLTWSEKGGVASVYVLDKDRHWLPLYTNCKKR